MAPADEKYTALTTYLRNGTPVMTPVWVVGLEDDRVGFHTSSGSAKAKRNRIPYGDRGVVVTLPDGTV